MRDFYRPLLSDFDLSAQVVTVFQWLYLNKPGILKIQQNNRIFIKITTEEFQKEIRKQLG